MSSTSLPCTPSPYACRRLPNKDLLDKLGFENPEDSFLFGYGDQSLRQRAYSFRGEDDDRSEDATPPAETDEPLLFALTRVGREITNLALSASLLRSCSGLENVSPTQEAEYFPSPADGDIFPSQQVDSPFTEDDDYSDDDDHDFWNFGEDLEDLVVYHPLRTDDDGDKDTVVEDEEVVCRPVSPDTTLNDDPENEVAAQDDENVLPRSVSPCPRTTDPSSSYTPEDAVVDAAPVSRSRRRGQVPPPQSPDTFPETADITQEQMSSWLKEKRTEFALRRCLVDPDAVIECEVPRCNGRPCGKRFTREDVSTARSHFCAAHFPEGQRKGRTIVVCLCPGCGSKLDYRDTGRHLDKHWGISYQCLFSPEPPISRTGCERTRARACRKAPSHSPSLLATFSDMSNLALTFSEVFDYGAYQNDAPHGDQDGKQPMAESEAVNSSIPMSLAYISSPFSDILNLPPPSETPTTSPLRRADSHRSVDLPWPMAAGPSCSPFDHILDEHERMTSDFGSEFGESYAVVYGDSDEEGEPSTYNLDAEDEQFDDGVSCNEDTVTDFDDDSTSETSESSTAAGSLEDEEAVFDDESQDGEDSSEDVGSYDELADSEDVPQDVPAPAASEDVSSFLRRSARSRKPTAVPYAPPAAPDKGKGKATTSKALPASRSATLKRARSPLPPSDDPTPDTPPSAPTRRGKRPRLCPAATQALLVIGDEETVECPVCGEERSLDDMDGVVAHFRTHYTREEKKLPAVPCQWGIDSDTECPFPATTFGEVIRHLKKDHLGAMWACPDCGKTFSRVDAVTRHRKEVCGKEPGSSRKKGKGRRK